MVLFYRRCRKLIQILYTDLHSRDRCLNLPQSLATVGRGTLLPWAEPVFTGVRVITAVFRTVVSSWTPARVPHPDLHGLLCMSSLYPLIPVSVLQGCYKKVPKMGSL